MLPYTIFIAVLVSFLLQQNALYKIKLKEKDLTTSGYRPHGREVSSGSLVALLTSHPQSRAESNESFVLVISSLSLS